MLVNLPDIPRTLKRTAYLPYRAYKSQRTFSFPSFFHELVSIRVNILKVLQTFFGFGSRFKTINRLSSIYLTGLKHIKKTKPVNLIQITDPQKQIILEFLTCLNRYTAPSEQALVHSCLKQSIFVYTPALRTEGKKL